MVKINPDKVLSEAKRLHALGFAVHWLRPLSKMPMESGWTTGPRKSFDYLEKTQQKNSNIGVRLGTPSKIAEGFLMVVDVDVKSTEKRHRDEALAAAKKVIGALQCPTVTSGRGNGSCHYYALTRETFKAFNVAASPEVVRCQMPSRTPSRKERELIAETDLARGIRLATAWEVSLYSDGRQVVLPPSIHPDSHKPYLWERDVLKVSDFHFLDISSLKPVEKERPTPEKKDSIKFDWEPAEVDLGWLPLSDELKSGIVTGEGVTDRSSFLIKAATSLLAIGLNQNEVLTILTDPANFIGTVGYDHASTKSRKRAAEWVFKYTLKKAADERKNVFEDIPKEELLTDDQAKKQEEEVAFDWREELDRDGRGKIKATLKTLDLVFTNRGGGLPFQRDLFANRIAYGCDTPWGGVKGSYLGDIDMVLVKRWFGDTEFHIEPSTNAILEATSLVAHRMAVHPVRDWLETLKWDEKPRLNTWLRDFCQAVAPEPYLSEISRKFILAMVRRVFEPGCQWDYVLVLEGKQGSYKSSVARALAGDKWFMDNLPDLKDKDAMLNLQGKWLIEIAELTNVKRSDYNLVKAYLIRRTDTVRPHYGRLQTDVPRQSVFIGTVNEGQYLKDPTGNRRFWPVSVGLCDVNGVKKVREQLFAEAVHLYRTEKDTLFLSGVATEQADEAQEERRIDDDETEMTSRLIEFMKSEDAADFDFDRFKLVDLFRGPWRDWEGKSYHLQTGGGVLKKMGFDRRKIQGQRIWGRVSRTLLKSPFNSKLTPDDRGIVGARVVDYDFL